MLRHPDPPLSDGVITLRAKGRDDVDTLVAICQDPEISALDARPEPLHARGRGGLDRRRGARSPGRARDRLARGRRAGRGGGEHRRPAHPPATRASARSATGSPGRRAAAGSPPARSASPRDWALRELGLGTLELMTHEDNVASQGVARAAGFTETGETDVPPNEGLAPGRYVVFTAP